MADLSYENECYHKGHQSVAGIDEAGRGPLAGPVTVAAVILPKNFTHPFLNDSKQLNEKKRDQLYQELTTSENIHWHCVAISPTEIDQRNILHATWYGMRLAFEGLAKKADIALIDGKPIKHFPHPQIPIIKGDSKSFSIAAASIIAKVSRDQLMQQYAEQYPQYQFHIHKGYPTPRHLELLKLHGPCPIHRCSFAPVAALLSQDLFPKH
jgi:ribonuclease HII